MWQTSQACFGTLFSRCSLSQSQLALFPGSALSATSLLPNFFNSVEISKRALFFWTDFSHLNAIKVSFVSHANVESKCTLFEGKS